MKPRIRTAPPQAKWVGIRRRLAEHKRQQAAQQMTLAEHAEAWWSETGNAVPAADTPEYEAMYAAWIEYAFAGM